MRNFRKFLSVVRKSINYDTMESSTRIQGYLIIVLIYIMTLIFCSMELTSFINSVFIIHEPYKISNEIIIIFSALLTHHLGILFNKRAGEKKDINDKLTDKLNSMIDEKFGTNGNSIINPTQINAPTIEPTTSSLNNSDLG